MDCLKLLNDLLIMVKTGEMELEEDARYAEAMLRKIQDIVRDALYEMVVRDVTDTETEYYAPEHESWKAFMLWRNGYQDYETVLNESFQEKELEALWQNSHIAEEMPESKIKEEMMQQIGQLKMISLVSKTASSEKSQKVRSLEESIKARIRGLYNMLYE
ncbi:MAG: hypothetical protein HDQ99_14270 [Lachnospiraceae bacterium]|nr:hypothetical protein [Lachnospiraceae bacterium]